jgi:hypothetical protein
MKCNEQYFYAQMRLNKSEWYLQYKNDIYVVNELKFAGKVGNQVVNKAKSL